MAGCHGAALPGCPSAFQWKCRMQIAYRPSVDGTQRTVMHSVQLRGEDGGRGRRGRWRWWRREAGGGDEFSRGAALLRGPRPRVFLSHHHHLSASLFSFPSSLLCLRFSRLVFVSAPTTRQRTQVEPENLQAQLGGCASTFTLCAGFSAKAPHPTTPLSASGASTT